MTSGYSREALIGVWVLVFAAAGMLTAVNSPSGWLVLTTLAVIPAIVFLNFGRWSQTMSESIQKGLR
jgi:hypothetical protein